MHMIVKIVTLQFTPESAETGPKLLLDSLEDTRSFPGCVSVELLEDSASRATLHLVERWSTPEDSRAYSEFRAGAGAMPGLGSMLAGPPSVIQGTLKD
jgi:quinol monooxygenase YgiN